MAGREQPLEKRANRLVLGSCFIVTTLLKVLLIPSYHSTDFEVHRNWIAITHSLRPSQWYFDTTSKWTLDYPPMFAWFQKLLGPIAFHYFDPKLVQVSSIDYASSSTIYFMRFSVIASDTVLFLGILLCVHVLNEMISNDNDSSMKSTLKKTKEQAPFLISNGVISGILIAFNGGLLLVDHIHFQYNGLLLGLLLLSMGALMKANNVYELNIISSSNSSIREIVWSLLGGTLFAMLLVMKHLYLPLAPVFFLFILLGFCNRKSFSTVRFLVMGLCVLTTMVLPFLPLIYDHYLQLQSSMDISNSSENSRDLDLDSNNLMKQAIKTQVEQISKRLFPFMALSDNTTEHDASELYASQDCIMISDNNVEEANYDYEKECLVRNGGVLSNAEHQRGLLHSYWAPNFWALYVFADRVLAFLIKQLAFNDSQLLPLSLMRQLCSGLLSLHHPDSLQEYAHKLSQVKSPSMGLVEEIQFAVLPQITPLVTLVLTLLAISPALVKLVSASSSPFSSNGFGKKNLVFIASIVQVALTSFVFGWHVHEKAILTALVPLSLLAPINDQHARLFFRLSVVGILGLFPLFSHIRELPTKTLIYLSFLRLLYVLLFKSYEQPSQSENAPKSLSEEKSTPLSDVHRRAKLSVIDYLFLTFACFTYLICEFGFPLLFFKTASGDVGSVENKFEFLPLMIMSVVCGVGVCYCWVEMTWAILSS